MEIMDSTSKDFEALSTAIVDRFFTNGTPLNDGVTKVATEMELTPEEIRRLVEKTNTNASVKFLSSGGNKESFKLASFKEVITKTHLDDDDDDDDLEKTATVTTTQWSLDSNTELSNRRRDACDAAFACVPAIQKTGMAQQSNTNLTKHNVVKAGLEQAKMNKIACENVLRDSLNYLISEFDKHPEEFSKFAIDSEALGQAGAIVKKVIHAAIPKADDKKKKEKINRRVIDDTSNTMIAAKVACESLETLDNLTKKIDTLERASHYYWNEACYNDN